MKITPTALQDVLIVEPRVFEDPRGFFMETYHHTRYRQFGIPARFVQDNLSFSVRGTLRGLHYQVNRVQAKLVQVITGEIYDVALDVRPGSATFGQWTGVRLSGKNRRQLFIPGGFAHGFCVLSDTAHFLYKCSDVYTPADEAGVLWSDPDIHIDWPVEDPIVSEKDKRLPCLHELPPSKLPVVERHS